MKEAMTNPLGYGSRNWELPFFERLTEWLTYTEWEQPDAARLLAGVLPLSEEPQYVCSDRHKVIGDLSAEEQSQLDEYIEFIETRFEDTSHSPHLFRMDFSRWIQFAETNYIQVPWLRWPYVTELLQDLRKEMEEILLSSADISMSHYRAAELDPYPYSDLPGYLELDNWTVQEAILLLAGLSPTGTEVEYGNPINSESVNIVTAQPLNEVSKGVLRFPAWPDPGRERVEEITKILRDSTLSADESKSLRAEFRKLKARHHSDQTLEKEDHSASFTTALKKVRWLWEHSDHTGRRYRKELFVSWALSKGIQVEWLSWAQEQGHFIDSNRNATSAADEAEQPRVQAQRESFLKAWFAETGSSPSEIAMSHRDLWYRLQSSDPGLFPPMSPSTIDAFFRRQTFCSFKKGRRPG